MRTLLNVESKPTEVKTIFINVPTVLAESLKGVLRTQSNIYKGAFVEIFNI